MFWRGEVVKRTLYLVCYDIRDKKRLRQASNILKGFASGKQYSCFECFLNPNELKKLLVEIKEVITPKDAFALIKIGALSELKVLGKARLPNNQDFILFD